MKNKTNIDNIVEPTKALECLEKLLDGYSKGMAGRSYYDTIKQALMSKSNAERCWEIVVEKQVDMSILKSVGNYMAYNEAYLHAKGFYFCKDKMLTEEEFELLKENL